MLTRNALMIAGTVLTAWVGANVSQEAIALPLSSDAVVISQYNPTSYTVETVEVLDVSNDDILLVQPEDGDYEFLANVDPEILSVVQRGDILYVMKSGNIVVDVARDEADLMLANIEAEAEAARASVRERYNTLSTRTQTSTPSVAVPRAQAATPSRPVRRTMAPVRGLW